MRDPAIEEAVVAFEKSRTGGSATGLAVASKLREYVRKDAIFYDPLTPTMYGSSRDYLFGQDIKVNEGFRGNLGGTSLVLAHEGVHRVKNTSSLGEELACFELQDDYYTELLSGVTFTSPISKASITARLAPGNFPEAIDVHQWRSKDQLIDFILTRGRYAETLSSGWIQANITNWRGLGNRWATTKGHYVRVLGSDVRYGQAILDILTSIKQPAEWKEMMRVAGNLGRARQALHLFCTAPVAGTQMRAIQNRWKVDLGAK